MRVPLVIERLPSLLIGACLLVASASPALTQPVGAELQEVASLPGEPGILSAAGVTRKDTPLLTIENPSAFDPTSVKRRLVIVGGLDGDGRGAAAAVAIVRWMKTRAPKAIREAWIVSALPMADPDGRTHERPLTFPPQKGFYEDPEQPESRYVWRWITYQAPDLVIEVRAVNPADAAGSLRTALGDRDAGGLGAVPVEVMTPSAPVDQVEKALARVRVRSPLHNAIVTRIARTPLDVARLLAARYPATPAISYIPALAWSSSLALASLQHDEALRSKVLAQVQPWTSGEKPLLGDRIQLTTVAGTLVFAEIARADPESAAARRLAIEGADAALKVKADGLPQYGQGWTDDMFMTSAILARTAGMSGRGSGDLDRTADLLIAYAGRLQQPNGIFNHASDGPAAWGRGNGFAAFGLMETLTTMPTAHPKRPALLAIFEKQMRGLATWQAPDGAWREVIDQPGAYREETATAMILTAMTRGVRLGWIDRSFTPITDRAWRALLAHIMEDGGLVDVCSGTGAGPTVRYYLDRPAVEGADDRGGAMALVAAMERISSR